VDLLGRFLSQELDADDLLFFLYVRSVAQKELGVSLRSRWTEMGRPGAAVLATAGATGAFSMAEAVGAFLVCGALITVFGVTGWFESLMNLIPMFHSRMLVKDQTILLLRSNIPWVAINFYVILDSNRSTKVIEPCRESTRCEII
jgi:hypothetical protein